MNGVQEKIEQLLGSGWTQQALADEMGMSWNGLRYWRTGERNPHNGGHIAKSTQTVGQFDYRAQISAGEDFQVAKS